MTQKLDYYAVLGLDKSASAADIKRAHQKAVMTYHPDRMRMKPPEEKAAGEKKFREITEAFSVLNDATKRSTYDSYGHQGLENLAAGRSAGTGRSYTDVAGPASVRPPVTEDDAFSFFDRKREQNGGVTQDMDGGTPVDRDAAREARRAAREARRNGMAPPNDINAPPPAAQAPVTQAPVAPPRAAAPATPKTPAGFDFAEAGRKMEEVGEKLGRANRGSIDVPLAALEQFRAELQTMLNVVDAAISRGRRGPGAGPRN